MRYPRLKPSLFFVVAAAAGIGAVTVAVPRFTRPEVDPAVVEAHANGMVVVNAPAQVPGARSIAFRSLTAGGHNTCGVTDGGEAFCWGHDGSGQLGTGRITQNMMRPERVRGGPWDEVAAGFYSTCGLRPDGTAFCWGSDSFGGLGTGEVHRGCGTLRANYAYGCIPEPEPVAGGLKFTQISSGGGNDRNTRQQTPSHHTCALTAEGEAWCWGSNYHGELGTGKQFPVDNPAPVKVATDVRFDTLTAGFHYTCGLARDASVWCWGSNYAGELGMGTPGGGTQQAEVSPSPRQVAGGLRFKQVDAGDWHTCGVTTDGAVYCWGLNDRGQLGTTERTQRCEGNIVCSPAPVRAATDRRFVSVTLGESHTCGLTTDGDVYCWGEALGSGAGEGAGSFEACPTRPVSDVAQSNGCVPVPTKTATSQKFTALDAGRTHTCALGRDRRAWCWGWGAFGLGLGIGRGAPVPEEVVSPNS